MTNLTYDEIISLYLRAKDKDEEVFILAQLTASDAETIIEVLRDAEVYVENNIKQCANCKRLFIHSGSMRLPAVCKPCRIMQRAELRGGKR